MCHRSFPVWSLSLGCPKNRVDTEKLLGSLGVSVKAAKTPGLSRLVFINTCAFIEPAVSESIRAIIDVVKKCSRLKKPPLIAVAGCLPGRYGREELAKEFPEVNLWLKPEERELWPREIATKLGKLCPELTGRLIAPHSAYAWLKICDGCERDCSFCAIPKIRGRLCSETPDDIISEARWLLKEGVKELALVGQDTTLWGKDWPDPRKESLLKLLGRLAALDGLKWLRTLYLYPSAINETFIREFAAIGEPLLPYFDIPLQHSERAVLSRMGRPFVTDARKIVSTIRDILPDAALRTTLIVGFPGETENDFNNLLKFVRETRFQNLGVFAYQPEDGTKAATFPDQIPDEIKEERRRIIMEAQASVSAEYLASRVGQITDVLVDADDSAQWPGLYKGRVWFQAPEIDGVTYISGPGVKAGEMVKAEITDSAEYDLSALA